MLRLCAWRMVSWNRIPSLKLTAKAPENGWFYNTIRLPFWWRLGLYSGANCWFHETIMELKILCQPVTDGGFLFTSELADLWRLPWQPTWSLFEVAVPDVEQQGEKVKWWTIPQRRLHKLRPLGQGWRNEDLQPLDHLRRETPQWYQTLSGIPGQRGRCHQESYQLCTSQLSRAPYSGEVSKPLQQCDLRSAQKSQLQPAHLLFQGSQVQWVLALPHWRLAVVWCGSLGPHWAQRLVVDRAA